jgi:hypothetical protein
VSGLLPRFCLAVALGGSALAAGLEWTAGPGFRSAPVKPVGTGRPGFTALGAADSGLNFANVLAGDAYLTNAVAHNGAGVAIGDVDADGWADVYLCSLQGPNRLFRNLGNWKFQELPLAGAAGAGQFSTGAALADVDGDADLDLLVNGIATGTRLFLNDGQGRFTEGTDTGFSRTASATSLALADVDGDGDLDLYCPHFIDVMMLSDPTTKFALARQGDQRVVAKVNGESARSPRWKGRFKAFPDGRVRELPEVHGFYRNDGGEKEQMSVGVAQNAVGGRLGSMSEPGALGRSYHDGRPDAGADSGRWGLNVSEQWANALREDPRLVFVTGWNEWIMGRFNEFNRVKLPVMFVDQFDQEHSRDLEPMRGGLGDDYFYQFVDHVRRYKGARPVPPLQSAAVKMDGEFADWAAVEPEFRDTVGDPVRRNHRGWDPQVVYANATGRNDVVAAKTSWTRRETFFYVRTREPLTSAADSDWMLLLLDTDADTRTGWLGYDFVVNRTRSGPRATSVERNVGGRYEWTAVGTAELLVGERELELSVPWKLLGLRHPPTALHFKWADHEHANGDWSDFTLNGDAAPNDRFNFRAASATP